MRKLLLPAVAALALLAPSTANAHTVQHRVCDTVWEAAAVGTKGAEKAQCLARVKAHNIKHVCAKPRPVIPAGRITVKHVRANSRQRANLTTALNLARKMRSPYNHRIAVIAAATQEQSAENWPKGHGTSVGFLQLINIHGTVEWRMQIVNSAGWFLRGARKLDPRGSRLPGTLAQDVQGSAHPTLYHQWVTEAKRTYRVFIGPCAA